MAHAAMLRRRTLVAAQDVDLDVLHTTISAARDADHLARCTNCREQAAVTAAAIAENGASIARRDRLTLGLRSARRAVTV